MPRSAIRSSRRLKGRFNPTQQCQASSTSHSKGPLHKPLSSALPQPTTVEPPIQVRRKKIIKQWTVEDMAQAIADREAGLSLRKCASKYGMSASAILNWQAGRTNKKAKGPPTMLTAAEEGALLDWCFKKCDSCHGVSVLDVKLKVAEICQTRHTVFTQGIPGKSWWDCFRKRHPELVFRVSEPLEQSRAIGFRPEIVMSFHENLKKLYDLNNYPPSNIWNTDETGFQGSRDEGMRVLACKGTRVEYGMTTDSREWMTVLCCVNAAGNAIPGYYIFKGQRIGGNYIQECEEGAVMAMQRKAWMTGELFHAWLDHFHKCIEESMGFANRHLLILDGHGSHVSISVVEKAASWGIDIITLPAHTSHKLQPLDVTVFKSLKTHFRKERAIWQHRTQCTQASKTDLASIAAKAFQLSCTKINITAGFRATRIWPLNPKALQFDGMPSQHMTIIASDEGMLEELASQVPNTPEDLAEGQAIEALTSLGTNEGLPNQVESTQPAVPSPSDGSTRILDILRLPPIEVSVRRAPREAFVDYTNSLILTSEQYIESLKAKNAKKEEIPKAKEEKRLERERKRKENLAATELRKQQREAQRHAKLARRAWEAEELAAEARLRAILWEGAGGCDDHPLQLHVDGPHHRMARRARLEKLRQARAHRATEGSTLDEMWLPR